MKPTKEQAAEAVKTLIRWIGDDPARPGLFDTPERVLRAWTEYGEGYLQDAGKILSRQFDVEDDLLPINQTYDELILSRDIPWVSHCEHHMAQIVGVAHVAYIPAAGGKIVGLSKLARIVDTFTKRLIVQERATEQISQSLQMHLNPRGVAVILKGKHSCQAHRGVKKDGWMVTSSMTGEFRGEARTELLSLISL